MSDYEPIEVRVTRDRYGEGHKLEYAEVCCPEAHFAAVCIEKWGMVAGMPDGEDSAGRARIRLATPEEVVERAMTVAELFYRAARARGWTTKIPAALAEAGKATG